MSWCEQQPSSRRSRRCLDERELCASTRSVAAPRRVGGEAPMPPLRPVVSSPPPSEPDVRLPPHPSLDEHNERLLARAAGLGSPGHMAPRGALLLLCCSTPDKVRAAGDSPHGCNLD